MKKRENAMKEIERISVVDKACIFNINNDYSG